MTTRQQLLDLAERVEREEPSRKLDAQIWGASGQFGYFEDFMGGDENAPRYTTSLDAAVTLVPDGTRWVAGVVGKIADGRFQAAVAGNHLAVASTPAAALTAAALRARAMEARDGTQIEYRVCLDPDCPQSVRAGDSHD